MHHSGVVDGANKKCGMTVIGADKNVLEYDWCHVVALSVGIKGPVPLPGRFQLFIYKKDQQTIHTIID